MRIKSIMFVCHGNICRSTMAEAVMCDIVNKAGKADEYHIVSRATSTEEIGNGIHRGTRRILERENIPYNHDKVATQVRRDEYDQYDYIIIMDETNRFNLEARIGGKFNGDKDNKIHLLMEYVGTPRDVLDPWYTGDFESTYRDVLAGCQALFKEIER